MDGAKTLGEAVRDALSHIQEIVRSEIRLAKVEVKEEAERARRGAIYLAAAAVCAAFGLGFLLLAAIYLLSLYILAWIAALIVAVCLGIAGLILLGAGRRHFRALKMPERTVATLKEDLKWAQQRGR